MLWGRLVIHLILLGCSGRKMLCAEPTLDRLDVGAREPVHDVCKSMLELVVKEELGICLPEAATSVRASFRQSQYDRSMVVAPIRSSRRWSQDGYIGDAEKTGLVHVVPDRAGELEGWLGLPR